MIIFVSISYNPSPRGATEPADEVLQLHPRLQEFIATLSSWGMTIYGLEEPMVTEDEDDAADDDGDDDDEEEEEMEPDVYPEDAGRFGSPNRQWEVLWFPN